MPNSKVTSYPNKYFGVSIILFATNKLSTVKRPCTVYCSFYEQKCDPVGKATEVYI